MNFFALNLVLVGISPSGYAVCEVFRGVELMPSVWMGVVCMGVVCIGLLCIGLLCMGVECTGVL